MEEEYQGKLELVKINADEPENEEFLRDHDIRSIPTLMIQDRNGKVWGKAVGAKSESTIREWIDTHMEMFELLKR